MPNRVDVRSYNSLVSVRKVGRGKPHTMGTVMLENVTVYSGGLIGDLLDEFTEVRELSGTAAKVMTRIVQFGSQFVYADDLHEWQLAALKAMESGDEMPDTPKGLTGEEFRAAYICGTDFYVDSAAAGSRKSHQQAAKV